LLNLLSVRRSDDAGFGEQDLVDLRSGTPSNEVQLVELPNWLRPFSIARTLPVLVIAWMRSIEWTVRFM
jgi:hypothetical protein